MTAPLAILEELPAAMAIPRRNGEPVFEAPWQATAFGMVVSMHQHGAFPWSAFKTLLIEEIAAAARCGDPGSYYDHWVAAFERLLGDLALLTPQQIGNRTAQFRRGDRPDHP
jgi:nitrile hydratase accessory protein